MSWLASGLFDTYVQHLSQPGEIQNPGKTESVHGLLPERRTRSLIAVKINLPSREPESAGSSAHVIVISRRQDVAS